MDYKCTVCGKGVTPAAQQYCVKNEYPVMCHKHQQEYGLNRYHVLSEVEKEVAKETADKEKAEREQREQQRKLNTIPLIESLVDKIVNKREYHYSNLLLHDLESARKENLITPDQYNQYITVYYANKDKKQLTSKQKADIWSKEVNKEIEALAIREYNKNKNNPIFHTVEQLKSDLEPLQQKYVYLDFPIDDYMNAWTYSINELSDGYCSCGDLDNYGKLINDIAIYKM